MPNSATKIIHFGEIFARHMTRVQPLNVLINDDQPSRIALLQTALERAGHEVIVEASGEHALDSIVQWNHDLVIVAQHLADLSGVDVMRQTRALFAGQALIPIIGIVADSGRSQIGEYMAAGAVDVLVEPIDVGQLLNIIQSIFKVPGVDLKPPSVLSHYNQLDELAADLGHAFVASLVSLSMRDAQAIVTHLADAAAQGRWQDFRYQCQKLSSIALSMDAPAIADIASDTRHVADYLLARSAPDIIKSLRAQLELLGASARRRGFL